MIFNVIGKKNYQPSVSDADREISTLKSYFTFQNQNSDLMFRSILGHIIPEAMVCYLENYSSDKFAQIFLGEFDTPESIWNAEMR